MIDSPLMPPGGGLPSFTGTATPAGRSGAASLAGEPVGGDRIGPASAWFDEPCEIRPGGENSGQDWTAHRDAVLARLGSPVTGGR